ncbi:MAG: hypothetical protein KGZ49_12610 [Syntrophaceae bacterium]|nr:hypothetical protein [Syntrophaceae bacterium]
MPETTEYKPQVEFKADPFPFVFRELDIIHREIIELKGDIKEIHKRFDSMNDSVNKRFDSMNESINKRFEKLYLLVIVTLISTLGSLIKLLFF